MRSFVSSVGSKSGIRARNPSALRSFPTFFAIPVCIASCKSLGQDKEYPSLLNTCKLDILGLIVMIFFLLFLY